MNKYVVEQPLDIIQFVSGNKKLFLFIDYLFEKAAIFNAQMKKESSEDYFPVTYYDSRGYAYNVEYEFFVECYVDFAAEHYGIDEDGQALMYQVLYFENDQKIFKVRHLFFITILGNYFSLGSSFYSDACKNKKSIAHNAIVKNYSGFVAHSRYIQIKSYVEKYLTSDDYKALRAENLKQVAYGKVSIDNYKREYKLDEIPRIYDISEI